MSVKNSTKNIIREKGDVPVLPEMPPRMIMDLRTDCNLKCPMCIVHGDPDNPKLKGFLKKEVDLDKAFKVLEEVAPYTPLWMPSLWSEPLLAHGFKPFVSKIKELGMPLALNTNALNIRQELAEFLIEVDVGAICISVDAMTPETLLKVRGVNKLDKIKKAIQLLLNARGNDLSPRIGVSITVQDSNKHEEEDFISYWTEIVDFVRVGSLYAEGAFDVETTTKRKACNALYNTMAIHANGNVSYCCLDGFADTSVGNVFEDGGVRAVWNGEKFNQVRKWHENGDWDNVPFCKNCDRWASYDFEEEVRDGLLIRKSPEYTYYNRLDRLENWTEKLSGGLHKIPEKKEYMK